MIEMPDDVITELIAAIVAARADGDGVLTVGAVRARLEAAKLNCADGENLNGGSKNGCVTC
jgi:hypothetical protein